MSPSNGGGQTSPVRLPRDLNPADIALPAGYRIEPLTAGLTYPTAATVDDQGVLYVVEAGYSYGESFTTPRLIRVDADGSTRTVAEGDNGPWTGVAFRDGAFYVAQGGVERGGAIVRITPDGKITPLVEGLPSLGDHHTNGPAVSPDGRWLYFSVGTATNSGVVGTDNFHFGWLKRHPDFHDVPAKDVTLSGQNFVTPNPFDDNAGRLITAPYHAFGTSAPAGTVVRGASPASGTVYRIPLPARGDPTGATTRASAPDLQLVAWGLRNPFGLAFSPDGALYVTENAYDVRGSRPIYGAGDLLWRITDGTWYGWPDFHGEYPVTWADHFQAPGKPKPTFLLAEHPNPPQRPAARFAVHASANGLDFARSPRFGYVGEAFVAEFGDMAPEVGKVRAPVGFKVVRVDPTTGNIQDFAVNKGKTFGPASKLKSGGIERPMAVRFSPDGNTLYVVDFGVMTITPHGPRPEPGTGAVWRITREDEP